MDKNIFKTLLPKGILRAGINMSNFLLVTGKKADGSPDGVSPDLVKQIALDLKVNYELIPFDRPGELADAVNDDIWDIGNIAYEPERANTISFTNPYVLIDANFLIKKILNLKQIKILIKQVLV